MRSWRLGPGGSRVARSVPRRLQWLLRRDALVAFGIYLVLTLFWDRAALEHMGSDCACAAAGDGAEAIWMLAWFPHALLHGLPLLHSHAMWSPTGLNLAGTTASLLPAIVLAPITLLFGPIVAYNLMAIAAPVSGAWCAYRLCRYVTGAPWASILAGASYGFSTYEIGHLVGHQQLYLIFGPPLLVLCFLRYLDGASSKRRLAVELVVLLLVEMFTGSEVLFTMTVLGVVALVAGYVLGGREVRSRIVSALPITAASYVLVLLLSSWYVYALLQAPAYAKNVGLVWPTDVLAFVVPMPYTWLGGGVFTPVTATFLGGAPEYGAYLGCPLILLVTRFILTRWSLRAARLIAVMLSGSILWVLGTHLFVAGKQTIWLPYSIFAKLPAFNEVMQGRVALYVVLLCAIALAMWLASSSTHRVLRWCCALIALAFVLPNFVHPSPTDSGVWVNPKFFATAMYKSYLRKGETILPITWGWTSDSPVWQAEDRMYYNMASGYFFFQPLPGWNTSLGMDLWNNNPQTSDASQVRPYLAQRDVSDVVVQQSEYTAWAPVLKASGLHPTAKVGGVVIYRVPSAWLAPARSRRGTDER